MLDPGPELAAATAAEAAADGAHMAGTVVKARSGLCERELWDLHLLAICWGLRDAGGRPTGEHVLRISAAALRPRSTGRVEPRSARPEDPPAIEHRPLSDPEGADLEVLVDGLGQALRIAAAPSLAAAGVRVEAPADGRAETLRDHARATLGCYYHPRGRGLGRVPPRRLTARRRPGLR
jgi:choline dehydrogenase-like flavoprotein